MHFNGNPTDFCHHRDYIWYTDSPFFFQGKKIFNQNVIELLTQTCVQTASTVYDPVTYGTNRNLDNLPDSLKDAIQEMHIHHVIHTSLKHLNIAYAEGTNRAPSADEQKEATQLLNKIDHRDKRISPTEP